MRVFRFKSMELSSIAEVTNYSGIWVSWAKKKRESYETGGAGDFGSSPKDLSRLPLATSSLG